MIPKLISKQIKQELEAIRMGNQGRLHPDDVVDAARDETSPLHPHFTWDDTEAAEKYRVEQARTLIKSVKLVTLDNISSAYVNVHIKGERYYQHISVIRPDELQSALRMAQVRLNGAIKSLEDLNAIAEQDYSEAIETVRAVSGQLAA